MIHVKQIVLRASGVGKVRKVALASFPNSSLPGAESARGRNWERDVVSPPWTMSEEGLMAVPREQPGIGVAVDRDRVEDLTVRRSVIDQERKARAC